MPRASHSCLACRTAGWSPAAQAETSSTANINSFFIGLGPRYRSCPNVEPTVSGARARMAGKSHARDQLFVTARPGSPVSGIPRARPSSLAISSPRSTAGHRGLRHRRFEGGEGAVGFAVLIAEVVVPKPVACRLVAIRVDSTHRELCRIPEVHRINISEKRTLALWKFDAVPRAHVSCLPQTVRP